MRIRAALPADIAAVETLLRSTPEAELWLAEFTDPDGNQMALMGDRSLGRA